VTSRVSLRLRGEREYSVPPLQLPNPKQLPPLERLTQYEAVRLFIERAQAVKADFEVNNDNAPAVAEICARLDGLPLAIELAAARVRLLPPQAMLARLESRLKLLTGGARDLPARQQTLRNAIEWSYDLLDDAEKRLFRRLAVFVGGRTLEAIEAVCNAEGDLGMDVLEGVESLLSKSLLRQEEGVGGEPRLVMLETIHEYAREKLEESGEDEELIRQHAEYFTKLLEEAEEPLKGAQQIDWLNRLEEEHDNVRGVLFWSLSASDRVGHSLQLVGMLNNFWVHRNFFSEGRKWGEAALALPEARAIANQLYLANALNCVGVLARHQADFTAARKYHEESLAVYKQLGNKREAGRALMRLGIVYAEQGDLKRARSILEEAVTVRAEIGDKHGLIGALSNLADVLQRFGEYDRARDLHQTALKLAQEPQSYYPWSIAAEHLSLGQIAIYYGDWASAKHYHIQSLSLYVRLKDMKMIAECLAGLAGLLVAQGQLERGTVLMGASSAYAQSLDVLMGHNTRSELDRNLSVSRSRLAEEIFTKLWEEGRAMTLEQAVDYALEET
jgi:predicted ATPase